MVALGTRFGNLTLCPGCARSCVGGHGSGHGSGAGSGTGSGAGERSAGIGTGENNLEVLTP